jgi:DNA-binding NtrC family response regulator
VRDGESLTEKAERGTALVVGAYAALRTAVGAVLMDERFRVIEAETITEARELLLDERTELALAVIDVIVSDKIIVDFFSQVRAHRRDLAIVFLDAEVEWVRSMLDGVVLDARSTIVRFPLTIGNLVTAVDLVHIDRGTYPRDRPIHSQ